MDLPGRRLKAVPVLLAVNVAVFLYQITLGGPGFQKFYALSQAGLNAGFWWQPVTHAFLHGNTLHLVFNMLGLWFAGRIVERVLGTGRFVILYFLGAIVGGLLQISLGGGTLLGASGAVFAVLIAFTTLFPEARVVALVFFIPVPLRAKYFGWGLAGSSAFLLVTGWLPIIGHAAHLGGCLAGYLFIRMTRPKPVVPPPHLPDSAPPVV